MAEGIKAEGVKAEGVKAEGRRSEHFSLQPVPLRSSDRVTMNAFSRRTRTTLLTSSWTRLLRRWTGSLRARLTVGLCLFILLILGGGSVWTINQQTFLLREAAEEQVREIGRAFATIGAAAILDNLFRIQEGLSSYQDNPDIRELDVIDPDNLIVAAKHPERIGIVLTDPLWETSRNSGIEQISPFTTQKGEPALVFVGPLRNGQDIAAWIRIEYSLVRIQHEITHDCSDAGHDPDRLLCRSICHDAGG